MPSEANPKIKGGREIGQGIATEPHYPKNFKGRGGPWACEKCMKTVDLPDESFEWTCEQCQTKMYTTPINECPLERARRFITDKRRNFQDNNNATNVAASGDSAKPEETTKDETTK